MQKKKWAAILLLITTGLLHTGFIKKTKTPDTLFLDSSDARNNASYQKILSSKESTREQAKWLYLMERVRQSPFKFVRNGDVFDGAKASRHLLWKSGRGGRKIKTAQDFIEKIASKSFMSGADYLVQLPNSETYPLRDVLENELRRLETYLQENAGEKKS